MLFVWRVLSRSTDEIPFAPGERLVHGHQVSAGNFLDELGLAQPLVVGAAFELNHGGERIHTVRQAACQRIFQGPVHQFQKWSQPWFHENDAAVFPQNALYL